MSKWRVGTKVPLNVYDGDRPVCQCHKAKDAKVICDSVNAHLDLVEALTQLKAVVLEKGFPVGITDDEICAIGGMVDAALRNAAVVAAVNAEKPGHP